MTRAVKTPSSKSLQLVLICIFQIETPSQVYLEYGSFNGSVKPPYYRETWFVVAMAAASIVIIIIIVAILCVQSKTYKYKGKKKTQFDMGGDCRDSGNIATIVCPRSPGVYCTSSPLGIVTDSPHLKAPRQLD